MRKYFLMLMAVVLSLLLCACSKPAESDNAEPTMSTEMTAAVTEPTLETEPEWFTEEIIDEALSYIFVTEGEKDIALAQELLLPLVEAGNAEAQYYWGYIYDHEIECNDSEEEERESLYWCRLSAKQGYPKAYLSVALNRFVEPEEKVEMIEQVQKAGLFEMTPVELGADGCAYLGSYYLENEDYENALTWYLSAAEMGSAFGTQNLGFMHENGDGVKQNYETAFEWFSKGAELGDEICIHQKGWYYQNGYGVPQSYEDALKEYRKAAELGYVGSMNNIGYLYQEGLGVPQNDITARNWYRKAAELNNSTSMYNIGWLTSWGRGAPKNIDTAMKWYIMSYANGDEYGKAEINRLLSKEDGVNGFFENYGLLISQGLSTE